MTFLSTPASMPVYFTLTVVSSLTFIVFYRFLSLRLASPGSPRSSRIVIPSPRTTLLPYLSETQLTNLPYPPDIFPGARDVETPYGVMRVYEWGPRDGRKVVLVHGDSTPAPIFLPMAKELVPNGCRVLLYDNWGRGYSDTPLHVRHDARLFQSQILFALSSSSISWTGSDSGGFSIIGFSLGGAIAMSFAANYHCLLNSIILLAPGGILRYVPDDYKSPFYKIPYLVPYNHLRKAVGKTLGVDMTGTKHERTEIKPDVSEQVGLEDSVNSARLSDGRLLDVPAVVQWQLEHHKGFVHSFVDTIRHGPIMQEHSDWQKVCDIVSGKDSAAHPSCGIYNSKILVIFGQDDEIVVAKHVSEDLQKLLGGQEHVEFHSVSGGHGFPVSHSHDALRHILGFWKMENSHLGPGATSAMEEAR